MEHQKTKSSTDKLGDEDRDNERLLQCIKYIPIEEELLDAFVDVMSRICEMLSVGDALIALSLTKRFNAIRLDYIWKIYNRSLRASRPSLTRKGIKDFLEMAVVKKDKTAIYVSETLKPGGLWIYDGNLAFSIHEKHYVYDIKTQQVELRSPKSEREKMMMELTLYPSCWGVMEFYVLQDRLYCFKNRESDGFSVYRNTLQEFIYEPYYDWSMVAESSYGFYDFQKISSTAMKPNTVRGRVYTNMECLACDIEKSLVYGLKCYNDTLVLYVFEKNTMKTLKEHVITRTSFMKLPRLGFVRGDFMIMVSPYEVHILDVNRLCFLDWQSSILPFTDRDVSVPLKYIDQSLRFVYYYLEEVHSDDKRMICWDIDRLTTREIILPANIDIFSFVVDPYLGLNGRCYYRVNGPYIIQSFDIVYK